MKIYIFLFSLLSFQISPAQDTSFKQFAKEQNSLATQAYEKKDDKTYDKLLKQWDTKYNKLSSDDKTDYAEQNRNMYYNFCCLYSLQNNKPKALEYFEKTVKLGYSDYQHTLEDTDLDNIRNEEKFKALQASIREVGDYLYILKQAAAYNPNDLREIPKFTYQSPDNPNLTSLRTYFKLDSIAGTGNEVSKILNLLHWIHNLVPHDGQHENPEIKNALSMVATCKKDHRGLNCRGLATVLNECYLSLGIPSRFLTCLPKDSLKTDQDCHVINMVYSKQLKKWLWIDPTNDAYVMNEKGELLSVEEVRDRLINDRPLIVNPDANWNHKNSVVKEEYLYSYMAKNLYMFECAVNSEYDMETQVSGKKITYVRLLPLEYYEQKPDKKESTNHESGIIFVHYNTNSPALFWQSPQ
jgi:hypothetical protein